MKNTLYLTLVVGEQWEDIWMDEVELGLNFVAPKIVQRVTILIEYQVLSTNSKSNGIKKSKHTLSMLELQISAQYPKRGLHTTRTVPTDRNLHIVHKFAIFSFLPKALNKFWSGLGKAEA